MKNRICSGLKENEMKDKEKLKCISSHLYYEFSMCTALTQEMIKGYPPGTINNALLQSFALHVRNLIDFLYNDKHQPDDVYAGDYFETPEKWQQLRNAIMPGLARAKKRANKEIAHLTYSRLDVAQKEKKWAFVDLSGEMVKAFDPFVTNVDRSLLNPEWDTFFQFRDNWTGRLTTR